MIRDSEIHESTVGLHTTLAFDSPIVSYDSKTNTAIGKEIKSKVESLSDLNSPKYKNHEVEITQTLGKKINIDSAVIKNLNNRICTSSYLLISLLSLYT